MNETVQCLKLETESLKKTQIEVKLDSKVLGGETKSVSPTEYETYVLEFLLL